MDAWHTPQLQGQNMNTLRAQNSTIQSTQTQSLLLNPYYLAHST